LSVSNAAGLDVVYISGPSDNATFPVSNDVTVAASAFTAGSVSQVNFYADGASIGSDATAPTVSC